MNDFDADLKRLARKSKVKRWLYTVLISLVTGLLLLVISYAGVQLLARRNYQRLDANFVTQELIQSPNILTSSRVLANNGVFGAELVSDCYKNIDGYQVAWAQKRGTFDWLHLNVETSSDGVDQNNGTLRNRVNREKIPTFTNPRAKDYRTKREVGTLKQAKNMVAEVAVTFDRPYTYREIQTMVPANLLINWYWSGTSSRANVDRLGTYIGVNADETSGRLTAAAYREFVNQVHRFGQDKQVSWTLDDGVTYKLYQDAVKQTPTTELNQAQFGGLIVSGRTENLLQLQNLAWAKSTVIGTMVPVRGDIKPLK
ncbi:sigma factor regulator N-terminal domain-containing protein [Lacticaseibacillus saniviri]|uniref:Anti-sigma factor n=3 Tax=Lacticaseibacillus saniviri TaxID=931533 RepID=A0A0R2MSP9_9LACO|nr:sigma factor regulator N-terminal domain-containing protein [Lacticaseibacillus saniviri]KRO16598.1 hypothetical protein IV56_GL001040 [Lacticaseibacillus saniviri JCM 17471 = DSM 24301]